MWNTNSSSSINPYLKKKKWNINSYKNKKQKQKTFQYQRNSYSRLPAKDYYLKEFIDGWMDSFTNSFLL